MLRLDNFIIMYQVVKVQLKPKEIIVPLDYRDAVLPAMCSENRVVEVMVEGHSQL